ncbi:MAG TPA: redox-sensing transcriptional repressor Rex [Gemmataceae bacterium]|nr:redox-sensing transcriptional repressor Rex [Gemmataceae bacterium]
MAKEEAARGASEPEPRLSRASVGRFSLYLRRLEALLREGAAKVSSGVLGEALGVTDAQVRKDLAYLGNLGHPGVGYAAPELAAAIRHALGVDRQWRVALAGVGNLGRALLRYRGFTERGFRITALFDADPAKIGQCIDGLEVHSPEAIPHVLPALGVELGVLTVPGESAQAAADAMAAAGVRGVLTFAPGVLRPPAGVSVVSVDVTVQLEQLAFLVQLGGGE